MSSIELPCVLLSSIEYFDPLYVFHVIYILHHFLEYMYGPLYDHLGIGNSKEEICDLMAAQMGVTPEDVRVIFIEFCDKEAISLQGCPVGEF